MALRLVNGLDEVCAGAASSYHAENLLLQVWVSLYRLEKTVKIREIPSYKASHVDGCYIAASPSVAALAERR
tara:strand:+ start:698 stop:913 length:216 start_codon:yes stop_codon:yes gene_type:complete